MNETLQNLALPARVGGHISIDYINTLEARQQQGETEYLLSYAHVLAWGQQCETLTDTQVEHALQMAQLQPNAAQLALEFARDVREILYGVCVIVLEHGGLSATDLLPLNDVLARLLPYRRLQASGAGAVWSWADDAPLECVLLPVVVAMSDLLVSEQVRQLRQCPNCGWLFLDTSRNHSRRWCSMEFCGSKVKSKRQYERNRQSGQK
ncbi:MAG: CGNR zinc finger domain-containing protein [Anaerolineae bacterium]